VEWRVWKAAISVIISCLQNDVTVIHDVCLLCHVLRQSLSRAVWEWYSTVADYFSHNKLVANVSIVQENMTCEWQWVVTIKEHKSEFASDIKTCLLTTYC